MSKCILVVDEAHNIVDIATEVNSDKLIPYFLTMSLNELNSYRLPEIYWQFVNFLKNHLAQKKKDLHPGDIEVDPKNVLQSLCKKLKLKNISEFETFLTKFNEDYKTVLQNQEAMNVNTEKKATREFLKIVIKFWQNWCRKYKSDKYFFCYNVKKTGNKKYISLEIVTLDPREITVPIFKKSFASLSMSGTVNPTVFNHLTGLSYKEQGYEKIETSSPFKSENILAFITEGIATNYDNRNRGMYKRIIDKISEIISTTPANIGIFCASYKILNDLVMYPINLVILKHNKKLFVESSQKSASQNATIDPDNFNLQHNGEVNLKKIFSTAFITHKYCLLDNF